MGHRNFVIYFMKFPKKKFSFFLLGFMRRRPAALARHCLASTRLQLPRPPAASARSTTPGPGTRAQQPRGQVLRALRHPNVRTRPILRTFGQPRVHHLASPRTPATKLAPLPAICAHQRLVPRASAEPPACSSALLRAPVPETRATASLRAPVPHSASSCHGTPG